MSAFVAIPESSFLMGSEDGNDDERPLHRVTVSAFEVAACTVTNADYARFAAPPLNSDPLFNDPRQPVVAVSWIDAMSYCSWLGDAFRLPFEAEWELAARGGLDRQRYPWGDDATYDSRQIVTGPDAVGQHAPNGYGLYDMCANVHEWCGDWYAPHYYSVSPERDPRGPESGTRRASRGGSWRHHVKITRCAARSSLAPDRRYNDYGFRIVRIG